MPENNQILSVESQLVGMPLAGPESFSQQQLDYLKRALGVDETVLFETDNPSSVTSIVLSESTMNFEWIEVDAVSASPGLSTNLGFSNIKFSPATIHSNGGYWWTRIYFDGSDGNSGSFTIHTCDSKWKNVDTASWTRVFQRLDGNTDQTNNAWYRIRKVVGIHRISGGNE